MRSRFAGLAWLGASFAILLDHRVARADETEACIQGAEKGYELKRENKLVEARRLLQTCAGPSCPSALAPSCVGWLAEVEAALPSVVVHARDDRGADLREVRVVVDGNLVASALDGTAIPIDPGPHTFRFELAGSAPQSFDVLIRSGEKNRRIDVGFASATPAAGPAGAPMAAPRFSRAPAVVAFVLGGLSLDLAAATGIAALVEKGKLDDVCPTRQTCPRSETDRVDRVAATSMVSTVALPVGATGIGLGILLWVLSEPEPVGLERTSGAGEIVVEPMLGLGTAGLRGRF